MSFSNKKVVTYVTTFFYNFSNKVFLDIPSICLE